MKTSLWRVARKQIPSEFFVAAVERWVRLGPSKAKSSYHGADNFHVEVPGYKHISRTSALASPMNAEHLLRKVLVPEARVLETLEDSCDYGTALFHAVESDSDDASDSDSE
ncbi:hypothetical protein Pst134EA_026846 [Puccinia striiformis f. sp. tritici]|uniref:hypothetical protein n=1 Tax=Puccinia striiformis f. sp. tritici TaxID=168172 RepID=UPI002007ED7B|nr:hypothetical protein Pst134EA_026846 [Puccinia striiformis f. sp. tritici]KAH9450137.1 hypothetical protein Pst134EA_026846 [Puccinia striiformis f. sp. tritici]